MEGFSYRKFFLATLIFSLCFSALIGVAFFLFGSFGEVELKVGLTTLAVGIFSLTGLTSSLLIERKIYKNFSYLGLISSALGFLVTIFAIWSFSTLFSSDENLLRWSLAFIVISIAVAHISVLLLITPKKQLVKFVRNLAFTCVIIVASLLVNLIFGEDAPGEFYFRLLGSFAILDVLTSILVPILNKFS